MANPLLASVCLLISLVLLWKGADLIVHSAIRIAHRWGISDLSIGMTVVALGTSAPEVVVTLVAATGGKPNIALANVVGSNVFNMGFILGATALLSTCPTPRSLTRRDTPALLFATLLLLIAVWDLHLARWEGLTMWALFIVYMVYVFRRDEGPLEEHEVPPGTGTATLLDLPLMILALLALLGGGHLLVESASALARVFGISEWAIGVTIVAAGTSAPECATCIMAALRGRPTLAAGNLVGSDFFNILAVLGLAAMVSPLSVDEVAQGSIVLMVTMVGVVLIFMSTGGRVNRLEGLTLIGLALMRWSRDVVPDLWG